MFKVLKKIWEYTRHILSARGLLDWLGWKQQVGTAVITVGTVAWGWIGGLPGPVLFAVAMLVAAATVIVWRGINFATQPEIAESVPPRESEIPSQAEAAPAPEPSSRLRFGEHNRVGIGPGIGYEASLIAIENAERGYLYRCHGIRATLTYTHRHTGETITLPGWFASIHNGEILEQPVESMTLDSKERNRAWLILYVTSHLNGSGQYRFLAPGPVLDLIPVTDWTVDINEANRLSYGQWEVKIAVRSDGQDSLERTENMQAE